MRIRNYTEDTNYTGDMECITNMGDIQEIQNLQVTGNYQR